jgi:hypothetical protein
MTAVAPFADRLAVARRVLALDVRADGCPAALWDQIEAAARDTRAAGAQAAFVLRALEPERHWRQLRRAPGVGTTVGPPAALARVFYTPR